MKKVTALVIMAMLVLAFAPRFELTAQEGRGRGEMDEERIKKIAEKHGITVEEVRERMAGARGGRGGQGGQQPGGRGGMMGGQPGMQGGRGGQQPPPDTTVAMTATNKYLFVVKGNYLYQFDINTLERKNKVILDENQGNTYIHEALKQRVETLRIRIEELREEGKNDEADKLEKQLKDFIERARKMDRKAGKGGWGGKKGGDRDRPAPAEGNPEGDVLF